MIITDKSSKQMIQWMITPDKMELTNNGKFMHCLPMTKYCCNGWCLDSPGHCHSTI